FPATEILEKFPGCANYYLTARNLYSCARGLCVSAVLTPFLLRTWLVFHDDLPQPVGFYYCFITTSLMLSVVFLAYYVHILSSYCTKLLYRVLSLHFTLDHFEPASNWDSEKLVSEMKAHLASLEKPANPAHPSSSQGPIVKARHAS